MSQDAREISSQAGPVPADGAAAERREGAPGRDQPPRAPGRWRRQFPYHWDADELVSRRELLRFTLLTSGSIFSVTTLFAVLGALKREPEVAPRAIARVDEVPLGGVKYFEFPGAGDQAVLLHLPAAGFVAYSQTCTHLSCAVFFHEERKQLVCPCHEGIFNPVTGDPVAGPPRRRLGRIDLRQEGDTLYAVAVRP